jgi:outer membrane protein OmpA-like peptidoglycan-associated protein
MFNPEEGEWATLDIAALTRTGLRTWDFKIVPEAGGAKAMPVVQMEGKGNVLKRFSWDGRDQKSGSFVAAGTYIARLTATDAEGTIKTEQAVVRVQRLMADDPTPTAAIPAAKKAKAKKKKEKVAATAPSPVTSVPEEAATEVAALVETSTPAAPATVPEEAASHAIWKQVIQFNGSSAELLPAVGSSLERIGKTLEVYPLQKVQITGFAAKDEPSPAVLAKKRADTVRAALIEQYQVSAKRIMLGTPQIKTGADLSKVELSITN